MPTSTITAITAPSTAERTGTAVRPLPGTRAKRTPVRAGAGSLAAAAADRRRDGGFCDARCSVDRRGAPAKAGCGGYGAQRQDKDEQPEPEYCPVEVQAPPGVDRAHRPDGGNR